MPVLPLSTFEQDCNVLGWQLDFFSALPRKHLDPEKFEGLVLPRNGRVTERERERDFENGQQIQTCAHGEMLHSRGMSDVAASLSALCPMSG